MSHDHLPPNPLGVWEFWTEHGSRILWDYDCGSDVDEEEVADEGSVECWMRIPAQRPDGTMNRSQYDGRWNRPGWPPHVPGGDAEDRTVRLGMPITVGVGFKGNWLTTPVVAIRALPDDEVPPPSLPILENLGRCSWRFQHDNPCTATGDDLASATRALVVSLDRWIDEQARRRTEPCRAALWWARRVDEKGSLMSFMQSHLDAMDTRRARLEEIRVNHGYWNDARDCDNYLAGNLPEAELLARIAEVAGG